MPVTVTMPQLGETVTEGTVLSWAKQVGESIAEDEVLLEISTDKVDTEVPSPVAGVITEILVQEGDTVEVGAALAVIAEPGEETGDGQGPRPQEEPAAAEAQEEQPAPEPPVQPPAEQAAPEQAARGPATSLDPAASAAPASDAETAAAAAGDAPRRGVLSPVVRRLAAEHEVDISAVPGTGEGGRITRKDVVAYIEGRDAAPEPAPEAAPEPAPEPAVPQPAAAAAPSPPTPAPQPARAPAAPSSETKVTFEAASPATGDRVVELSRLRKRIAENMVHAKRTAAHVWASVEVDYEAVERVRRAHKEEFKEREGFSLTYLPFITRATIDALAAYPVVNSSFDLENGRQTFHAGVNLGIAVDMDQEGLVVVTIRGADGLRLRGLAREIRTKAEKIRGGKLEPDDVTGSTFTITNPGPYGSFMTAPIINVPNVGILSTDTITKRPTVITLPDGSDTIAIHHIGYLGLTWDHRAFDGSTAVLFLNRIKSNLQTWDWEQELL